MQRKTKWIVGGAVAAVAVAGASAGVAVAAGDDDNDQEEPISGEARDAAEAAALEHTGEGRVTETEVGDEESYYEVEVTLEDGSQVDVQLTEDFNVVGSEADGAGEDESDDESDDDGSDDGSDDD